MSLMGRYFMKVPKTSPLKIRASRMRPAQLTFADLGRWCREKIDCGRNYLAVDRLQAPARNEMERVDVIVNYIRSRYEGREVPFPEEDENVELQEIVSRPTTSAGTAAAPRNRQLEENEIQVAPEEATAKKAGSSGAKKNNGGRKERQQEEKKEKPKKGVKKFFSDVAKKFKRS